MNKANRINLKRVGLTLVEIIIGIALMAMIATSLSMMTEHVVQVSGSVERLNEATQTNLAIERHFVALCDNAIVSDDFSGIHFVATTAGHNGIAIRDTIGDSLPNKNEIVFLTHDPDSPNQWCMFRPSSGAVPVPIQSDTAGWSTFFESTITDVNSDKNVLTPRLATTTDVSGLQPIISWQIDQQPTETEITSYRSGSLIWSDLKWPQGKYTTEYGLQRNRYSIMLMVLDSDGHAVPVHLNCNQTKAIES